MSRLASYAFAEEVALQPRALGAEAVEAEVLFGAELRTRHALACGLRLREILPSLEIRPSNRRVVRAEESLGTIRGRLNVSQYLARRFQERGYPRRYPVLVTRTEPRTPENELVVRALKSVKAAVADSPFPARSAEGRLVARLYRWNRTHLGRWPWREAVGTEHSGRLLSQVAWRLSRRQTGNDAAYRKVVLWWNEYSMRLDELGADSIVTLVGGLLAFPAGDLFWDKVFEIWVLAELSRSLEAMGATLEWRAPLTKRGQGPVEQWLVGQRRVYVWFQRQEPLGAPRWRYNDSTALTGIPDVTLTSDGRPPLVVDAKYRLRTTDTRSEETYKMLGYAENFRSALPFMGVLVFPGADERTTVLQGPDGGRLAIINVDATVASLISPAVRDLIVGWAA